MREWCNSFSQVLVAPLAWILSLIVLLVDLVSLPFKKRLRAPNGILITGATSGIGEALALHYARPGVTLALTGRNADALKATAEACQAKGAKVYTKRADVSERDTLSAWIREVDEKTPLDLVIANAGVTENTTSTQNDLENAARTIFATNVDGVFNTIFPIIPRMQERRYGQVVLLASLASFGALSGSAAYSASKAAIRVYGDGLRAHLYRYGIHVNVVCPGFVKSPMTDANKFSQPGKVSMKYAIHCITEGISKDETHIAFPTPIYVLSWMLGSFPSAVRDVFARFRIIPNIAYLRSKSSTAGTAEVRKDL